MIPLRKTDNILAEEVARLSTIDEEITLNSPGSALQ
jgi:hypothetical protein